MVKNSPIAKWSGIQAVIWIADKIVWYSDHQMNSGQLSGIWILDNLVSAIQMPAYCVNSIWIADKIVWYSDGDLNAVPFND